MKLKFRGIFDRGDHSSHFTEPEGAPDIQEGEEVGGTVVIGYFPSGERNKSEDRVDQTDPIFFRFLGEIGDNLIEALGEFLPIDGRIV